jgi:hypothetical protein
MGAWPGRRPTGKGSCLAYEATDGDDGVGEFEEGVDDFLAALVAVLEPGLNCCARRLWARRAGAPRRG